jgi:predicted nucleic acid-binding protein
MKYVLDANVALKWVLSEPEADKALRVRAEFEAAQLELIVPDVFPVEVAHALTRAERRRLIQVGDASFLLADITSTLIPMHDCRVILQRAVTISSQMRCGVYDCLYVALAEQENCEVLTADDKMVKRLQPNFPFVISLSTLP